MNNYRQRVGVAGKWLSRLDAARYVDIQMRGDETIYYVFDPSIFYMYYYSEEDNTCNFLSSKQGLINFSQALAEEISSLSTALNKHLSHYLFFNMAVGDARNNCFYLSWYQPELDGIYSQVIAAKLKISSEIQNYVDRKSNLQFSGNSVDDVRAWLSKTIKNNISGENARLVARDELYHKRSGVKIMKLGTDEVEATSHWENIRKAYESCLSCQPDGYLAQPMSDIPLKGDDLEKAHPAYWYDKLSKNKSVETAWRDAQTFSFLWMANAFGSQSTSKFRVVFVTNDKKFFTFGARDEIEGGNIVVPLGTHKELFGCFTDAYVRHPLSFAGDPGAWPQSGVPSPNSEGSTSSSSRMISQFKDHLRLLVPPSNLGRGDEFDERRRLLTEEPDIYTQFSYKSVTPRPDVTVQFDDNWISKWSSHWSTASDEVEKQSIAEGFLTGDVLKRFASETGDYSKNIKRLTFSDWFDVFGSFGKHVSIPKLQNQVAERVVGPFQARRGLPPLSFDGENHVREFYKLLLRAEEGKYTASTNEASVVFYSMYDDIFVRKNFQYYVPLTISSMLTVMGDYRHAIAFARASLHVSYSIGDERGAEHAKGGINGDGREAALLLTHLFRLQAYSKDSIDHARSYLERASSIVADEGISDVRLKVLNIQLNLSTAYLEFGGARGFQSNIDDSSVVKNLDDPNWLHSKLIFIYQVKCEWDRLIGLWKMCDNNGVPRWDTLPNPKRNVVEEDWTEKDCPFEVRITWGTILADLCLCAFEMWLFDRCLSDLSRSEKLSRFYEIVQSVENYDINKLYIDPPKQGTRRSSSLLRSVNTFGIQLMKDIRDKGSHENILLQQIKSDLDKVLEHNIRNVAPPISREQTIDNVVVDKRVSAYHELLIYLVMGFVYDNSKYRDRAKSYLSYDDKEYTLPVVMAYDKWKYARWKMITDCLYRM